MGGNDVVLKNSKKPKRRAAYGKATVAKILKMIEEGNSVKTIGKDPSMPSESTIWRWRKKKPDFKIQFDKAYQQLIYRKIDDMMTELKKPPLNVREVMAEYGIEDVREAKLQISILQEDKRQKNNILQFTIRAIAPKLVEEMSDKVKVEHEGTIQQAIQVVSYAIDPEQVEKEVNRILEHEDDPKDKPRP